MLIESGEFLSAANICNVTKTTDVTKTKGISEKITYLSIASFLRIMQ